MKCWVKRLWVGGMLQPRHFLCMRKYEFGVLSFDVVKSEQLKRPTKRLRFDFNNYTERFPDLYDAELEQISGEEFIFRGLEAPEPHGGLAVHYAQAWEVSINEPAVQRSSREFEETQRARGYVAKLPDDVKPPS